MKNWQTFLGCLALSAGIWLIHNLSNIQTDVVTIDVVAQSNIPGRAFRSAEAVPVTARCKASGFRLFYLNRKKEPVTVHFDAEDFNPEGGDFFSIPISQLYRYSAEMFGSGSSVESFLFDKFSCRFISELYRKLPVTASTSFSFRPQYMQIGDISLKPDSVLVYGPADILTRLSSISTSMITRSDIRNNQHGEAALEIPSGVRLSQGKIDWSLNVSRYVEVQAHLPVRTRNVPGTVSLNVFPSTVDVLFKCVFPLVEDPADKVSCYVDYKDFILSKTGHCVVRLDNLPKGVLQTHIEPEIAECLEKI